MGALDGVRVVDLGNAIHGPYAAQMLADMGADVIKIEPPHGELNRGAMVVGDRFNLGSQFFACNRNKRTICLDLKQAAGLDVAKALISLADVLIENTRPGVMDRLGLGYEALSAMNPRLIYGSATAYGVRGPRAQKPSVDIVGQAAGGLLAHTGTPETGPLPAGSAIGDHGGSIWLAYGIVLALYARDRTGRGQHVTTSLLGSQIGLQQWELTHHLMTGQEPPQAGRAHPLIAGSWRVYRAADGHFALGLVNDPRWPKLCRAIERPELIDDPRFATSASRLANTEPLVQALQAAFEQWSLVEVVDRLDRADQTVSPVVNYEQLVADEQVRANGYVVEHESEVFGQVALVGLPVELSETPGAIRTLAPRLDEHTGQVLQELGYTGDEIAALYASQAAGAATGR